MDSPPRYQLAHVFSHRGSIEVVTRSKLVQKPEEEIKKKDSHRKGRVRGEWVGGISSLNDSEA